MTSLQVDQPNQTMPEYDDHSFLTLLIRNMKDLNKRVESMERKLDKFLSKYGNTTSCPEEGVQLAHQVSSLVNSVSMLSKGGLTHTQRPQLKSEHKVKTGIIMPVGELYVDPNLISNMTGCLVTVQSPCSNQVNFTTEPEFIILQPSSDICELGNPDFRNIQLDVQKYIDTALKMLSTHTNTHVFITSLPPRFDREEASRSTDLWNNILLTETFLHNRVHVVQQSGLECMEERKMSERYRGNRFLLTPYGTRLLSKNIATSVIEVTRSIKINHSEKSLENSSKEHLQQLRRKL